MDIVILNGNPDTGKYSLDAYLEDLGKALKADKHRVKILNLRDMEIKFCTGCWSCWWGPTPGECVFRDESALVCRDYINSDLVVMASPVLMGFTSAVLKKVQDKLIPLIHPYIEIVNGECHHKKRYDRYPAVGLILERDRGTDDEDVRLISRMFQRFTLNLRTRLVFSIETALSVQEVKDAIGDI